MDNSVWSVFFYHFFPVIALDEESLGLLSPIYKKYSKTIRWEEVLAIYTLEDPSAVGSPATYVIPKFRTNDRQQDEKVNYEITQNKNSKQAKASLMKLIKHRKIYRIPPVQKYYELLEEICNRSTNAIIDEETKELITGKGRVTNLIFSKGVRNLFSRIFTGSKR